VSWRPNTLRRPRSARSWTIFFALNRSTRSALIADPAAALDWCRQSRLSTVQISHA
jgi:hypothetical protein